MFTPKRAIFTASLLLAMMTGASLAETPNLGKPIDEAAIAAWDISILPDGTGLAERQRHACAGGQDLRRKVHSVSWRQRQRRQPPPRW